jgi:hypothetical protein
MRNQNGVVLNLVATTQGLNFKLGVDGIKIELTKPKSSLRPPGRFLKMLRQVE